MGYTLKYNIFRPDAREQRAFQRFPVQVAVLFSPTDRDFSDMLSELFLHLDQLTGKQVVFFAVLDPPRDWLEVAGHRPEWRDHERNAQKIGFSVEDRVLVYEIARLFGVGWNSLPSLVIATNLWNGDLLITPTNPWKIERQLSILTSLAKEFGEPNIDQIAATLEETFGFPLEKVKAHYRETHRLHRLYEFLDVGGGNHTTFDALRFNRLLDRELESIHRMFSRFRAPKRDQRQRMVADETLQRSDPRAIDEAFEYVAEETRGSLVAPSTVAMKFAQELQDQQNLELVFAFEEESRIMIETALRHGDLLERRYKQTREYPDSFTLPRPNRYTEPKNHSLPREDFTPGAQGIWKAFELEINHSVVQAARTSRGVKMPEYFTYHDPTLPKGRDRVRTLKGKNRSINTADCFSPVPKKHRFLALGDAYHVTEAMLSKDRQEDLEKVIQSCLGGPLPPELLTSWIEIARIRNPVSHTRALKHQDYQTVLNNVLNRDVIEPLICIKRKMSNRY